MAVAVINYIDLVELVNKYGFPTHTKVKLAPGGVGYKLFDDFIRANVRWVTQLEVDPLNHVRIIESADHIGEIPDPWATRYQGYLEGTSEWNSFKPVEGEYTHVNRHAIQMAVSTTSFRYQVDYRKVNDGSVATNSFLSVAIFDKAEDSSLSYNSELEVDQLWTTKIDLVNVQGSEPIHALYKRAYFHDPIREDSHPWVFVGPMTDEELELWTEHNVKSEPTVDNLANVDFRDIDETKRRAIKSIELMSDTMATVRKGISHLAQ